MMPERMGRQTGGKGKDLHGHDLHGHEVRILRFLEQCIVSTGVPPSYEEIRQAVNLASKNHVFRDLNLLEEKGYIERNSGKSRTIRLRRCADGQRFDPYGFEIPICGKIAAGEPIAAPGNGSCDPVYETITLTRDIVSERDGIYALRVAGNSMVDALVNDGDIVVLRKQPTAENGDMVAVWLKREGETTLKRFFNEGDRVRLQPENPTLGPIFVDPADVRVQGKVITVIRPMAA
jgi:repressor LexA